MKILKIWVVNSFDLIVCSVGWVKDSIAWVIDSVVSIIDSADWVIDSFGHATSFSNPKISKLSISSITFSALVCLRISNSSILWTLFSGLTISAMNNSWINWYTNGSFSKGKILMLSISSITFSALVCLRISNSSILCVYFLV